MEISLLSDILLTENLLLHKLKIKGIKSSSIYLVNFTCWGKGVARSLGRLAMLDFLGEVCKNTLYVNGVNKSLYHCSWKEQKTLRGWLCVTTTELCISYL